MLSLIILPRVYYPQLTKDGGEKRESLQIADPRKRSISPVTTFPS